MPCTPSAAIPDEDKPAAPYIPPSKDAKRLRDIEAAVHAHTRAYNSDPFAGPRIRAHMVRGIALPSDVLSDANQSLAARDAAKITATEIF